MDSEAITYEVTPGQWSITKRGHRRATAHESHEGQAVAAAVALILDSDESGTVLVLNDVGKVAYSVNVENHGNRA